MSPLQALLLGMAAAVPVTLWVAGQILLAGPGGIAIALEQGVHALWLLQGLSLLVGTPLLADRSAIGHQLIAVSLVTTLAWPLFTLAVLADGVSWDAATTAGSALLVTSWLVVSGATLGLRVLPAGVWEPSLRFVAASTGGMVGWATRDQWLGWLAGL